jgi:hypothetical protein
MGKVSAPEEAIRRFKRLRDRADDLLSAERRMWDERTAIQADINALQRGLVPDPTNRAKEEDWQGGGMWAGLSTAERGVATGYPLNSYELDPESGELVEVSFKDGFPQDLGNGVELKTKERVVRAVKDPRLVELGRRWRHLRDQLAELDQRRAQVEAARTPLGQLVAVCREYLERTFNWREDGNPAPVRMSAIRGGAPAGAKA